MLYLSRKTSKVTGLKFKGVKVYVVLMVKGNEKLTKEYCKGFK